MKPTVLIVEDNADLRELITIHFEGAGFQVVSLAHGLDLISQLRKQEAPPPQVMILDLMLPGRSGYEMLGTIKSKWPQTRIFVFTSHEEYRNKIPGGLVEGFFLKTDGIESLVEAVKKQDEK